MLYDIEENRNDVGHHASDEDEFDRLYCTPDSLEVLYGDWYDHERKAELSRKNEARRLFLLFPGSRQRDGSLNPSSERSQKMLTSINPASTNEEVTSVQGCQMTIPGTRSRT